MSDSIKPLCIYMGSKMAIADWIVPMFPKHKTYVEVFGGTAAILLNKPKSPVEIYNDKNIFMSNLFECIIRYYDEFKDRVSKWNVSEVRYSDYFDNHIVKPSTFPDLEAALRYYYVLKVVGYGKYTGGFYVNIDSSNQVFDGALRDIENFHKRFKTVLVFSRDFERLIRNTNKPDTLFYLDPPYKGTESYYEKITGAFEETDHIKLRDILYNIKGMFYLSYEDDAFVRDLYSDPKFSILEKEKFRPGQGEYKTEIVITNHFPEHNFLFSQDQMNG